LPVLNQPHRSIEHDPAHPGARPALAGNWLFRGIHYS
jgi:hypothetical protein